MLTNIDLKKPNHNAFIIVILSFFALIGPLSNENILFWIILFLINFFILKINFKILYVLKLCLLTGSLYLQFILDFQTFTKEFFVHVLGVLLIFKFFELKKERDYFFFVNLSFFISVISLLDGQDLISSVIALLIMFWGIYLLYIINQIELPEFQFKNFMKILGYVALLVPIIVVTYIVFPRLDVNINLLQSSQNSLGIPDKIRLGSFNSITNTRDKVFDANFDGKKLNQKELYFRVKVFDILTPAKEWISAPIEILSRQNFRYKDQPEGIKYEIIVSPNGKKWVPVLDYSHVVSKQLITNPFNSSVFSKKDLQKNQIFKMRNSPNSFQIDLDEKTKDLYLKLPDNNFSKFKEWVEVNYDSNPMVFSEKILNKFRNDNFFYTLTPQPIGNEYETFFFQTKEGYCEYYAGTFVILARLAGIPSRIVTGYYGGEYNEIGNFYTFRQADAHSWVEILVKGKGWIRFDPTDVIPLDRVDQNNNIFLENRILDNNQKENKNVFQNQFLFTFNKMFQYLSYVDYRWTNFFLSYNKTEQKKLYERFSSSDKLKSSNEIILLLFILVLVAFPFYLIVKQINNPNFVIKILIKQLNKKGFQFNKDDNHFVIFDAYSKQFKDKNFELIKNFYEASQFKNEKINFFYKLKIYFTQKKTALTN